ncbi:MAG: hypothetical protein LBO69_06760 [Ignavibacteria bacterium]|nr:hypothetical protein [Ignavibacteria bacterium]
MSDECLIIDVNGGLLRNQFLHSTDFSIFWTGNTFTVRKSVAISDLLKNVTTPRQYQYPSIVVRPHTSFSEWKDCSDDYKNTHP